MYTNVFAHTSLAMLATYIQEICTYTLDVRVYVYALWYTDTVLHLTEAVLSSHGGDSSGTCSVCMCVCPLLCASFYCTYYLLHCTRIYVHEKMSGS